jgi:cysteine protease ATG4
MKFTYRRNFETIDPYFINDDAGWGCMIRVAQMMMAQILTRAFLGRTLFIEYITFYLYKE